MTNFMQLAFEEAKIAYEEGNLPVGAVLTITDQHGERCIGRARNQNKTRGSWSAHAEQILISNLGHKIREGVENGKKFTLYTTFEPCLQCFGAIVMNRISNVYYACPDLFAGTKNLIAPTKWYETFWPKVHKADFFNESRDLLVKYFEAHNDKWHECIEPYKKLKE